MAWGRSYNQIHYLPTGGISLHEIVILSSYNTAYSVVHPTVVSVGLSEILKAKQKLGVTFNFDKQDVIDFKKFSKMTMCRASEANTEN